MKPKATWDDIDKCLSQGTLEDQNFDTLVAFSRVSPPPSNNPAFHVKFQSAQTRIIERIRQIDSEKKSNESTKKHWHDSVLGKISIGVITGVIVFIITHFLNL